MPMKKVLKSEAVDVHSFNQRLLEWLSDSGEPIIGEPDAAGVTAWLFVRNDDRLFRLHADTRREGVRDYLALCIAGQLPTWNIVANQRGTENAVSFGEDGVKVKYFYLYLVDGD